MTDPSRTLSLSIPNTPLQRVVIIGGGFAGMNVARHLNHESYQVVMLDKHNYHTFVPLLYQVATGGLEPDAIVGSLRKIFDGQNNVYFRMLKVQRVDPARKTVHTSVGSLTYDYLVIATGTRANYFGNEHFAKYTMPLKELPDALNLRSQVLQCFEKATLTPDATARERLLHFLIVGGGPTGVEMAGALSEMKKRALPQDYPDLDVSVMHITLVEGQSCLLPTMSEEAGATAQRYLEQMGVTVQLSTLVEDYDGEQARFKNGDIIATETLIWGAGVQGATIKGVDQESIDHGKYVVNDHLQVRGYDDIFAVGDIALHTTEAYPKGYPGVAQVAIQQGQYLAKHLHRLRRKQPLPPFKLFNKGVIAVVGRNRAVGDLPAHARISGWFAWMGWWTVHIFYLVGFRNKWLAMSNWAVNYVSNQQGLRLIVRPFVRPDHPEEQDFVQENETG